MTYKEYAVHSWKVKKISEEKLEPDKSINVRVMFLKFSVKGIST